jgi:hypothetical protein
MECDHTGTHSGASRYIRETGELRLVLLCDRCGAEREELGRIEYRPEVILFPGVQPAEASALSAEAA